MNLVLFSVNPLAGAPWHYYQCIKKYTDINVRLINQKFAYSDGRAFPHDIIWKNNQAKTELIIKHADIVVFHNYLPAYIKHVINRTKQKIIGIFHSVPRLGNWKDLMSYAHKSYVIDQPYQVNEYKELETIPTLFDMTVCSPINKRDDKINIVYAPSNRYNIDHKASKGFNIVFPILKQVQSKYRHVDIKLIEKTPYFDNLEIKRHCHIMIDDILHNTYHLTSVEGCCFKMPVLTGIGDNGYPFVKTNEKTLASNLLKLIENKEERERLGNLGYDWVQTQFNPMNLTKKYMEVIVT